MAMQEDLLPPIAALQNIVEILEPAEFADWRESGRPGDHLYLDIRAVRRWLEARHEQERKKEPVLTVFR